MQAVIGYSTGELECGQQAFQVGFSVVVNKRGYGRQLKMACLFLHRPRLLECINATDGLWADRKSTLYEIVDKCCVDDPAYILSNSDHEFASNIRDYIDALYHKFPAATWVNNTPGADMCAINHILQNEDRSPLQVCFHWLLF